MIFGGRNTASANGHDVLFRVRAHFVLPALVAVALTRRELRVSRALAALVRTAAERRRERRLAAGVVVFADVHEEQALLEQLARFVEREGPLSPALYAYIERLVGERNPPPVDASLSTLRKTLSMESTKDQLTGGSSR